MDESKFQYWTIIIKLKKRDYCKKSDNIRTMVKATVKTFLKKIMKFILNSPKSKTENVAPEELEIGRVSTEVALVVFVSGPSN